MPATTPKPVTYRQLIIFCATLFLALLLISAGIAYWFISETKARFLIKEQAGWIKLPESLNVTADIKNAMQFEIDQSIHTKVPIQQSIDIPIEDNVEALIAVDTSVPINMKVPVDQVVNINQTIAVDTQVEVSVAGVPIKLPIKGDIPITADVPVQLEIPVNEHVPIKFSSPVNMKFSEPLKANLDTVLDTDIPIQGVMEVPVTSRMEATLSFPQEPIEAGLYYLDMTLPVKNIALSPIQREAE